MLFFKKWASAPIPHPPDINEKRLPTRLPASGPECGLAALPNELVPAVLKRLDIHSLFRVAKVSRRFNEISTREWLARHGITSSQLSAGHAIIRSDLPGEAFVALRIALFIRARPLTRLTCTIPFAPDSPVINQLDSFLTWFSPRLATTELDLGVDLIPHSTAVKSTARAVTKFIANLSADCPTTVFVLKDGLFTCRPDALRRWSPATGHFEGGWAETSYSNVRMHDGSRQRIPAIRSLRTLSIKYPLHATLAPFDKWKLVVLDAASLTDLQLYIKLASQEWSAILDGLLLPALVCVGLWAEAISTATSARFFNRHPTIRTIKYMSPTADSLPRESSPLSLPSLETLNTLAPYLVHVFSPPKRDASCADADADASEAADTYGTRARFPHLAHIELRPHARFHAALALAAAHTPLRALTLWSLAPAHFPSPSAWPVFPNVLRLTLNESCLPPVLAAGLPGLLAHAFPALRKVEVNYSNPDISKRQAREQRAFVEQVRAANPGVHTILFDGREYPTG
ncbi:hypothetical protein K438DRAFT_1833432 [Mycena galopus ATCC 62051]|nr:hypothetical protein K438DRAFT_1833432 [Mycena galopus ATCC 62051]